MKARIVAVTDDTLPQAVDALASAFTDYAMFTYVLPPAATVDRDAKLAAMIRYYAWRRLVRGWPLLALETDAGFEAAIAANPPHDGTPPPGEQEQERRLAEIIGADAEARRKAYENATDADPGMPHFFIGMVGVRPPSRGKGHAAQLMHEIHARSQAHPTSRGVALCTENEANLRFYEHLGYRVTSTTVVDSLQSWALWRDNETR